MRVQNIKTVFLCLVTVALAIWLAAAADSTRVAQDRLWHHRNLGKAFYENPTTQKEAVAEFKKALDLAPASARERVNYGLALLRAGETKEGVAELEKAQKQDPKIPHTWFNLGIAFKKDGDTERAIQQFEQMVQLTPDEPKSHYNLGVLYKLAGKKDEALAQLETAARLDPNLGGPHFQLFNQYRQAGRDADAAAQLKVFQEIKKRTAGAAIAEDMEWSYYAEVYETVEAQPAEAPAAELKWQDRAIAGRFDPATSGLAVLDADGDGRADLLAWSAERVVLLRNGETAVAHSGLEKLQGVIAILPGDFDNDGLPDLCVLTNSGAALYRNQKGTFAPHSAALPQGRFDGAVWIDYDHDGDIDLILLGEKSVLARNEGAGGFSDQTAHFPFATGHAAAGTLFAFRHDTSAIDLAVAYRDGSSVLYHDRLNGRYEAETATGLNQATSVVADDFDNDGYPDLAVATPAGVSLARNRDGVLQPGTALAEARGPIAFVDLENRGVEDLIAAGAVYRNRGRGVFVRSACTQCLPESAAAIAADFDSDGRADLALITGDGALRVMLNRTATRNNWLRVALAGVKTPKLAPGATVEVKTGASYQKRIYTGLPLLFGVASYKDIDAVRITWPNGLIQNETRQAAAKSMRYEEQQRLSGSCPMIFAWDGKQFRFITDVLGVAPLGASSGDGQYFPVDHDEYVQIPSDALALVDGRYEIRIAEELREVSYLDQIHLIAVDHPARTEIFTNDKFKSPPFPDFRLFGVATRLYPRAARDGNGHDVLGRLLNQDRAYPDNFRRDVSGIAETHALDLDFGAAAKDGHAVLVLNGWVDWADGSTFLRAAQQPGAGLVLPYLQVKDAAGAWRTVIADMGIPAGKPKTIAVDLTGKWLSASREIRVVTNLCVYWDEIFLSEDDTKPDARLTRIAAETADLHFRGFSKATIHPQRRQPEAFDYARLAQVSMWNPTPGSYTRYGDVRPLLEAADDRMVIMGSGDELRLLFPARDLPPLQQGWTRDFLLLVDGWAKDGDYNTAYSQSVDPLPFHRMSAYPYSAAEHFPDDAAHREYREKYNTRSALRLLRNLAP
ncbi:MAG: VCBS repeat-containing protein [Candidatus Solibacter usitatus]|nr:VCBS repeat-containing protein [Candidatus Solibacter usitatus]